MLVISYIINRLSFVVLVEKYKIWFSPMAKGTKRFVSQLKRKIFCQNIFLQLRVLLNRRGNIFFDECGHILSLNLPSIINDEIVGDCQLKRE